MADRLAYLCACIHQRYGSSLAMFQAWVATGELKEASTLMLTTGGLGAASDSEFEGFRNSSCSQPLLYRDGLAPRVGRSGSVQVVQSLRVLPPSLHPRCFLTGVCVQLP
jgi:hypothetical protein